MMVCARDIRWAALALLLYGIVGQMFTKPSFLFPSTFINSELFQQLFFGIPVQLVTTDDVTDVVPGVPYRAGWALQ